MGLRHDEQECEAHYDEREDAEDDIEKGRIKFSQRKLYGRDEELSRLHAVYDRLRKEGLAQIIFLLGYSGVGKSTLVKAFIEQLQKEEVEATAAAAEEAATDADHRTSTRSASTAATDVHKNQEVKEQQTTQQDSKEGEDSENDSRETAAQKQLPSDDGDDDTRAANFTRQPTPPSKFVAPWFISGKYAKLQSPVPYSAIADGINNFCKSLLNDKERYPREQVIEIGERLRLTIGIGNLQVLTELIPELGNLVNISSSAGGGGGCYDGDGGTGTGTTDDDLDANSISLASGGDGFSVGSSTNNASEKKASVHRVKQVFRNFIKALSTKERPLLFFLDDLQWSDVGSMDLLSVLLYDTKLEHVMFVGSYRSNEVHDDHALTIFMNAIEKEHSLRIGNDSKSSGSNNSVGSFTSSHMRNNMGTHSSSSSALLSSSGPLTSSRGSLTSGSFQGTSKGGDKAASKSAKVVERLELGELRQDDIAEFISDTLNLRRDEVQPLTDAIYNKTLGNIFFTMQAMEELVRKNALFYDVMIFKWDWNLNRIQLEDLLSDDIVAMVKDKIQNLPKLLQRALTTASFIRATFDTETLLEALQKCTGERDRAALKLDTLSDMLEMAVDVGLLIKPKREVSSDGTSHQSYTFAHDKIQEASSSFVSGEDKHLLLFRIAKALIHRSQSNEFGEDWMLFVGVHHMNSIPRQYHADKDGAKKDEAGFTNPELTNLNLMAAKISIVKSAFPQAVELLRAGASYLDEEPQKWINHYDMCFDLYHRLMETEYSVGNHDMAQKAVDEILKHAKSNEEKCYAHHYTVEIIVTRKDRNFNYGADKATEYLASHGIRVPKSPSKMQIFFANVRVKLAKRNRSLIEVADLRPASDYENGIMQLLEQLTVCAGNVDTTWAQIVTLVAQQFAWQRGFSEHLPPILSHYAIVLRGIGGLRRASKFGPVALELLNKHCQGHSLCRGLGSVLGCVVPLRRPYHKVMDGLHEAYRVGISCGDVEWGCLAAMQYGLSYFCSGWPISTTFEPKVIHFEDEGRRLQQPPSIIVSFSIMRQTLMNLKGKGSRDPVEFKGPVLDEEVALEQFEGSTKTQTLRDLSIFRLMLAMVFDNIGAQLEMVDRLVPYPEFQFPMSREHLLVALVGLASFRLGHKRKDPKYTAIGRQKYRSMKKLAKVGSENAPPILACFIAEEDPSRANYDRAIAKCSAAGLLHFEALMNEHCARYLFESGGASDQKQLGQKYMATAMWLYYYWGAMGKVTQMREEFRFLRGVHQPEKLSNMALKYTTIVPPQVQWR